MGAIATNKFMSWILQRLDRSLASPLLRQVSSDFSFKHFDLGRPFAKFLLVTFYFQSTVLLGQDVSSLFTNE